RPQAVVQRDVPTLARGRPRHAPAVVDAEPVSAEVGPSEVRDAVGVRPAVAAAAAPQAGGALLDLAVAGGADEAGLEQAGRGLGSRLVQRTHRTPTCPACARSGRAGGRSTPSPPLAAARTR